MPEITIIAARELADRLATIAVLAEAPAANEALIQMHRDEARDLLDLLNDTLRAKTPRRAA